MAPAWYSLTKMAQSVGRCSEMCPTVIMLITINRANNCGRSNNQPARQTGEEDGWGERPPAIPA